MPCLYVVPGVTDGLVSQGCSHVLGVGVPMLVRVAFYLLYRRLIYIRPGDLNKAKWARQPRLQVRNDQA